jgi:subtilisin family serine protease
VPGHGCAPGGEILIGKVLSNGGSGGDQGILAGINWAVAAKCQVISMSLGAPVAPGAPPSPVYEIVAQRALKAGTLIVAAAGNESARPGRINPVGRPANCPSILAVAALDNTLRVAPFSNGGINPSGGGIDIAGPGVAVFSSLPRPRLHGSFNGTSMATPHVAGIAALLAESNPQLRGRGLWQALVSRARRLLLPSRDVGAGLVQAP